MLEQVMSDQHCSNCQYYMHIPTGGVCNAFKEPTESPLANNECTEWVRLDHKLEAERHKQLQARVIERSEPSQFSEWLLSLCLRQEALDRAWNERIPSDVKQRMREAVVQNIERLPQQLQHWWSSSEYLTPEFWHEVSRYVSVPGQEYWGERTTPELRRLDDTQSREQITREQAVAIHSDWFASSLRQIQEEFIQATDVSTHDESHTIQYYASRPNDDVRAARNWAGELVQRREAEQSFRDQYEIRPEPRRQSASSGMSELSLAKLQEIMHGLPDPEDWWLARGGSHYEVRICPPAPALSWSMQAPMPQTINYETIIFQVRYRGCWVYQGDVVME